jgi:hypothetical protein
MEPLHTERRIRWASILVAAGLLVQLGTFSVVHPLAFTAFLLVGCPLVAAGVVLYLVSLLPSS